MYSNFLVVMTRLSVVLTSAIAPIIIECLVYCVKHKFLPSTSTKADCGSKVTLELSGKEILLVILILAFRETSRKSRMKSRSKVIFVILESNVT